MKGNDGICWLSMPTGACSNACHPGLCELLISPIGVGLSSSGSAACGGRERGWRVLSAELEAELAACGCAAAPFPAWSGCLAAWFTGNISLVLPWLQELLRRGTGGDPHGQRRTIPSMSRSAQEKQKWLRVCWGITAQVHSCAWWGRFFFFQFSFL